MLEPAYTLQDCVGRSIDLAVLIAGIGDCCVHEVETRFPNIFRSDEFAALVIEQITDQDVTGPNIDRLRRAVDLHQQGQFKTYANADFAGMTYQRNISFDVVSFDEREGHFDFITGPTEVIFQKRGPELVLVGLANSTTVHSLHTGSKMVLRVLQQSNATEDNSPDLSS